MHVTKGINAGLSAGEGQSSIGDMHVAKGIDSGVPITEGQGAAVGNVQGQLRQGAVDCTVCAAGPGELIRGDVFRHVQGPGLGVKGKAGNTGVQIDLRKFRAVQPQPILQGGCRLSGDFHLIRPVSLAVQDGLSVIFEIADAAACRDGNGRRSGGQINGGFGVQGREVLALRAGSRQVHVVTGSVHGTVADPDGVGSDNASGPMTAAV